MYKHALIEVIAPGKKQEDKAYREKAQKLFDKYGISPTRVFSIDGRKAGEVFAEAGEFEDFQAAQAAWSALGQDKEWQKLQKERQELGTVLPGTGENLMLFGFYP